MNWLKTLFGKKLTVATHNGDFHADDVFGVATLKLWAEKNNIDLKVIRTRDQKILDKADITVDVGSEYDPERKRFDHHQHGGAGEHHNKIPNAAFGLVWKHYGESLCSKEVAGVIEDKMVIPLDARDNGINLSSNLIPGVSEYLVKDLIRTYRPDWDKALNFAIELLKIEIAKAEQLIAGEKKVREEIARQNNPEILILDEDIPWEKVVSEIKEIKLVIYPEPDIEQWCIEAARDDLENYDSKRVSFPETWRGWRGDKLVEITGIKDAIFCHRAGFFGVAKTKDAGLEMAKKALDTSV